MSPDNDQPGSPFDALGFDLVGNRRDLGVNLFATPVDAEGQREDVAMTTTTTTAQFEVEFLLVWEQHGVPDAAEVTEVADVLIAILNAHVHMDARDVVTSVVRTSLGGAVASVVVPFIASDSRAERISREAAASVVGWRVEHILRHREGRR